MEVARVRQRSPNLYLSFPTFLDKIDNVAVEPQLGRRETAETRRKVLLLEDSGNTKADCSPQRNSSNESRGLWKCTKARTKSADAEQISRNAETAIYNALEVEYGVCRR